MERDWVLVRVGPPFPSDDPRTAIQFVLGDQRSDVTVRLDVDGDLIDREEYSPVRRHDVRQRGAQALSVHRTGAR